MKSDSCRAVLCSRKKLLKQAFFFAGNIIALYLQSDFEKGV